MTRVALNGGTRRLLRFRLSCAVGKQVEVVGMQGDVGTLEFHFSQRPCPACQQCARPEAVLILTRRQATRMVLVTCGACHHRGIFVVTLPAPSPAAVSYGDVGAMRRFLNTFDGDFRHLFGGESGGQLATE